MLERSECCQIQPNTTYKKYNESAHMSLVDHPINQTDLDISAIWAPIIAADARKAHLHLVYTMIEVAFYVGNMQGICLFSDDFYSDNTLVVKQCVDIGVRPHACVECLILLIHLVVGLRPAAPTTTKKKKLDCIFVFTVQYVQHYFPHYVQYNYKL
jgi:hypothetical protein